MQVFIEHIAFFGDVYKNTSVFLTVLTIDFAKTRNQLAMTEIFLQSPKNACHFQHTNKKALALASAFFEINWKTLYPFSIVKFFEKTNLYLLTIIIYSFIIISINKMR